MSANGSNDDQYVLQLKDLRHMCDGGTLCFGIYSASLLRQSVITPRRCPMRRISIFGNQIGAERWLIWIALLLSALALALLVASTAAGAYVWLDNFDEALCLSPTFETQPQSQTVNVGSDVTYFVAVSGTEPFAYQWAKDGDNIVGGPRIQGATSPSLSILNIIES
jgi:hypothetical protein